MSELTGDNGEGWKNNESREFASETNNIDDNREVENANPPSSSTLAGNLIEMPAIVEAADAESDADQSTGEAAHGPTAADKVEETDVSNEMTDQDYDTDESHDAPKAVESETPEAPTTIFNPPTRSINIFTVVDSPPSAAIAKAKVTHNKAPTAASPAEAISATDDFTQVFGDRAQPTHVEPFQRGSWGYFAVGAMYIGYGVLKYLVRK